MTSARGRGAASLACSEGGRSAADVDLAAGDACATVKPVSARVLHDISRKRWATGGGRSHSETVRGESSFAEEVIKV